MYKLKNLVPEKVFMYFEDICNIPHGSGNTDAIADYCVDFARKHGLWHRRDEFNNIIIKKSASAGYEKHDSVIIQGHLDMVCEKLPDCSIDFECDPLDIDVKDGYIYAKGTTLGGDDGIAIAMAMAVLSDDSLSHPEIYAVFTSDEETGMDGAINIDFSDIPSKILLNIDSEQEGVLTVSCAGGARCSSELSLNQIPAVKQGYKISVSGLTGGHSGVEIDRGRLNANVVMASLIDRLMKNTDICLSDIKGGFKDNAITRECYSLITADADIGTIKNICEEFFLSLNKSNDPEAAVSVELCDVDFIFDTDSTKTAVEYLNALPYGVIKMSDDIDGLVETSLNFGLVWVEDNILKTVHSVRSSKNDEKEKIINLLKAVAGQCGASSVSDGGYPAWEYKPDSKLRSIMVDVYKKMYGQQPTVEAIHAGLECGLFCDKITGLDAVSFGPDIHDIHTPKERLEIASVERSYKYLCKVLEEL